MKYPNKINKQNTSFITHANRGMKLEALINSTNKYYNENNIALIFKRPTPVGIVDVSYQQNKKIINKAYFQEQSTLDYNGIYKGRYIDFDAKECASNTSFPLSNIHKHQTKHIKDVIDHQGISFLIIKLNTRIYYLDGNDYLSFINNNDRKSIPLSYFEEKGIEIKEKYNPDIDYLKAIDEIYFKGE